MGVVILTWDNIHDIDLIRDENGDAVVFPSFRDADEWMEEGDHLLCKNRKAICFTEDMNPNK